ELLDKVTAILARRDAGPAIEGTGEMGRTDHAKAGAHELNQPIHVPQNYDTHPKTYEMELRMVGMLNEPGNGPRGVEPSGIACIGGSEARMLVGLAHQWNWRKARVATG
ncbi:MAG: hypothetical protein V3V34_08530, partial [Kiloniellales bacterium]